MVHAVIHLAQLGLQLKLVTIAHNKTINIVCSIFLFIILKKTAKSYLY